MTIHDLLQATIPLMAVLIAARPLGWYMARAYQGEAPALGRILGPIERWWYRRLRIEPSSEMTWQQYARSVLALSLFSVLVVYLLQRTQKWWPLNPVDQANVSADSSFNTAISFATNTNWQGYAGEATMSYWTQMVGLAVQNFVSAAVGMAVLVALIRGLARASSSTIGNFWGDVTRGLLYILLPLSLVLAIGLVTQGVVQTFRGTQTVNLIESIENADGRPVTNQSIALGPVASQVAIKQLGTNGGGYFNANSAHPLENPTPLSNLLQVISILLIPAGLCHTFGEMINDRRQGWAMLAAMVVIFVPLVVISLNAEKQSHRMLLNDMIDHRSNDMQPGGNMEGKETRFGISNSAYWSVATTAASNGSVNSMHDSNSPIAGLVEMWLMQLGEVVFGGVGSGLYGMIVFAIVAVFIAGLMVGRTPEYLGKKIGPFEIKMASLAILLPGAMVLFGTAAAVSMDEGKKGVLNSGPHAFSEVLYAFSSAANNNGSAFAGLSANTPFYNGFLGIAMLVGRFWVMLPVLAIAGSMARRQKSPVTAGTLPTHTPLFVALLVMVVVVIGALSFFPALALGPIVEQLQSRS